MAESVMLEKAKDFAVDIVTLCKEIKESNRESVLTNHVASLRHVDRSKYP